MKVFPSVCHGSIPNVVFLAVAVPAATATLAALAMYVAQAPLVEYIAPAPAVSCAAPALFVKNISPAPAMSYVAPRSSSNASRPLQWCLKLLQRPSPITSRRSRSVRGARACLGQLRAGTCRVCRTRTWRGVHRADTDSVHCTCIVEHAAPTPAVHAASAPVVHYIASAPAVFVAPAPELRGFSAFRVCHTSISGGVHSSGASGKLRYACPCSVCRISPIWGAHLPASRMLCRTSSRGGVRQSRASSELCRSCACWVCLTSTSCGVHSSGAGNELRIASTHTQCMPHQLQWWSMVIRRQHCWEGS